MSSLKDFHSDFTFEPMYDYIPGSSVGSILGLFLQAIHAEYHPILVTCSLHHVNLPNSIKAIHTGSPGTSHPFVHPYVHPFIILISDQSIYGQSLVQTQ